MIVQLGKIYKDLDVTFDYNLSFCNVCIWPDGIKPDPKYMYYVTATFNILIQNMNCQTNIRQ